MSEQQEFIARMEASGIAPTWETIYALNVDVAGLRAQVVKAHRLIDDLRGQLIEAQASMSFLQSETAAAQADERARRERALSLLGDVRSVLDDDSRDHLDDAESVAARRRALEMATEAIRILTRQHEEEAKR